jgi:tetratricopeptide (TPR) repeat protein
MKMISRIIISIIALAIVGSVISCSRELTAKSDEPEQPFEFQRIPVLSGAPPPANITGSESTVPTEDGIEPDTEEVTQELIDSTYNQGRMALITSDNEMAVELLTRVVEWSPEHTKALYNLSMAYRHIGNIESAEIYATRAAESDPQQVYVHYNLGMIYLQEDRVDEAIDQLEQELLNHPDDQQVAEVANVLAKIYLNKGMPGEAFDAAMRAVNLNGEVPDYYITLGDVQASNSAWDLAIEAYQNAINMNPDEPLYRMKLAELLWDIGRLDDARVVYHDAIELEPGLEDEIPPARL